MSESSPSKIEFKVRFTYADVCNALVSNSWFAKNWLPLVCGSALLLIIAAVAASGVLNTIVGPTWSALIGMWPPVFLFLAIVGFSLSSVRFQIAQAATNLMKTPSFSGEIHVVLDADGMESHWTAGHSAVQWSHFVRWTEQRDVFCLFSHSRIFNIIPKRCLSEPEIVQIRELLGTQIKASQNVEVRKNKGKMFLIGSLAFLLIVIITFFATLLSLKQ